MEIENDQLFKSFIKGRDIKESTAKNYLSFFRSYCKLVRLTPTELIEEAEDEEDQNIRLRLRKIKIYLERFQDWMIEQDYSPSNIRIQMATIKLFYKFFDITIPYNNVYKRKPEPKNDIELIPSLEDISYALEFVYDLKYKAIIKLIMSSGMGRSEICSLKISDFINSVSGYIDKNSIEEVSDIEVICNKLLNKEEVIPEWRVVRQKIGLSYITFSNTESVHAICEYLLRYPPESLDDYLFRNNYGKQLSVNTFMTYFNRINKRAGFENRDRLSFFRSHNLRKFFATTLMKHRMSKWDIDRLMGHVVKDQDDAYFKIDPKTLKDEYMKHVKYLSLERVEYKRVETEEYKELIHEMDQKDEKISGLEKKQEVLERMVKELMQKQLKQ